MRTVKYKNTEGTEIVFSNQAPFILQKNARAHFELEYLDITTRKQQVFYIFIMHYAW